jgi:hypothetical protein
VPNATDETWQQVNGTKGESVGVIAAQSIGEPGTQLDIENIPRRWYCFQHGC